MSLAGNIAPVVGGVLFCLIAYIAVRRANRKDGDPLPTPEAGPAE